MFSEKHLNPPEHILSHHWPVRNKISDAARGIHEVSTGRNPSDLDSKSQKSVNLALHVKFTFLDILHLTITYDML